MGPGPGGPPCGVSSVKSVCLLVNGRGTRKGARLDTQRTTSDRDRCEIGAYANRLERPDGAQTTSPEGQAAEPRVPAASQPRKASAVCKRHDRPSDAWSACRGLRRGERARPGVRGLPQVIVRRVVGLLFVGVTIPAASCGLCASAPRSKAFQRNHSARSRVCGTRPRCIGHAMAWRPRKGHSEGPSL